MTQEERLSFLIRFLLAEDPSYAGFPIPGTVSEQRRLLRGLLNVRPPKPISNDFLEIQDAYLQERLSERGVQSAADLAPLQPGLFVWQGDITTLRCDAIVNAANSQMLGCFVPCHGCIDNAIHTYAGVQLRLECAEIMRRQGHAEETGQAKLTKAYNLPCRYVLHTVGPIVQGAVTKRDKALLESCYRACLELALENGLRSVAFCCISTGEFHFPNEDAARIAVRTVQSFRAQHPDAPEVIFNVFQDKDAAIYRQLL